MVIIISVSFLDLSTERERSAILVKCGRFSPTPKPACHDLEFVIIPATVVVAIPVSIPILLDSSVYSVEQVGFLLAVNE
jgi:hypothetical protein